MTELKTNDDLRTHYKKPSGGAVSKDIARIDKHFAHFISRSPFLCIGTTSAEGLGDVSPRGGEPGFVHVLDENTLAMPDRPGNNRLDSLTNVTEHPGVGLLFFIPGLEDCLRINGLARVSMAEDLMQRFTTADDKRPRSVLVIDVKEAYLHCPKAIKRANLWNPDAYIAREDFPTPGQIYRDQMKLDIEASAIDASLDKDSKENLY